MVAGELLIQALPQVQTRHWRPLEIGRVVCDSRQVEPGDLFVAIPGVNVDGHRFVPAALQAGAVAVVVERELPDLEGVPTALVPDARQAFAYLHAALRGFPARALRVIGVTGTEGKTTTTRLIGSILRAAGYRVGVVDSVAATIADEARPTGLHTTTPDAPEMQAYLAEMVERGVEYAVLESTSHGLVQQRVAACEYDVAVITNITHDHLDYHGTYEAYRAAKGLLFQALSESMRKPDTPKVAVLNADDPSYAFLRQFPADRQITYAVNGQAEIKADEVVLSPTGLHVVVRWPQGEMRLTSPLVGRYNAYNFMAAVGVGLSQNVAPEAIQEGVAAMRGVEGRMERIDLGQPFTLVVDFAHSPIALENALTAARDLAGEHKVIVAFGCPGLRDRAKRPWMGEIAGRLADRTIITADDPRTESLEQIMAEIATGCEKAGAREGIGYWRVGDRSEAIDLAVKMAESGDVVIAAGKGHERSICFGTTEYPWSDQDVSREALRRLGYGQ
jgi:UDP-N-acetylmuramoyl-L-alanyl-D-glutamate--2,6-diaminopimelate ligase